jgi:hypothetical protein
MRSRTFGPLTSWIPLGRIGSLRPHGSPRSEARRAASQARPRIVDRYVHRDVHNDPRSSRRCALTEITARSAWPRFPHAGRVPEPGRVPHAGRPPASGRVPHAGRPAAPGRARAPSARLRPALGRALAVGPLCGHVPLQAGSLPLRCLVDNSKKRPRGHVCGRRVSPGRLGLAGGEWFLLNLLAGTTGPFEIRIWCFREVTMRPLEKSQ